jgi:hypothetical protein
MKFPKLSKVPPPAAVRVIQGMIDALDTVKSWLLPPEVALSGLMANSLVLARGISIVAELRVADHLRDGAHSIDELARLTGCESDALYRLLRALASFGIFEELEDKRFGLGRLGDCLRSDSPTSLRSWTQYGGAEWPWWDSFLGTLRNGKTVHENVHQMSYFEWHQKHPEYYQLFSDAMREFSVLVDGPIVAACDLAGTRTLADIGGGRGSLLATILRAHPDLRGTLFDVPSVLAEAQQGGPLAESGIAERCQLIAGSFFDDLPPGRDAYLLKWILHDWNDEDVRRILRNCRRAMGGAGKRLLVAEMLIESGNRPSPAKVMDIFMLALVGGRERTIGEYRALFADTGFKLERMNPTASPFWVLEGVSV